MKGLPVLMPGGRKRRRCEKETFHPQDCFAVGSHEKGPFQPVHPRLAPFHSKLAISFQTGSIPWMKLPCSWESPSKSKAKGWGIWSLHKTFGRWSLEELGKKQHQQGWICLKNPEILAMMASSNAQNERN